MVGKEKCPNCVSKSGVRMTMIESVSGVGCWFCWGCGYICSRKRKGGRLVVVGLSKHLLSKRRG